jgi:flagellar hook-length control protein FliK
MNVIVPATTVPTVNTTSTTAASGKTQQTTSTVGKTAGKSDDKGTFTQVLGGQMTHDASASSTDDPTDAAVILAGLLQMLQSLTLPIQTTVQTQGEASDNKDQGLPKMLLTAMNSNSQLTDRLLQDPNVQQWFQQTQALLSALKGKDSAPSLALTGVQSSSLAGAQNLQAQNTLLTLTSLLKEQPNNVILQHVVQDLQKVIEPVLPLIVNSLQVQAPLVHETQAAPPEDIENKVLGQTAVKNVLPNTNSKHTAFKKQSTLETGINNIEVVSPTKSKLELLTAKNAVYAPLHTPSVAVANDSIEQIKPELTVDSSLTAASLNVQFTDMLKAPVQTGNSIEAAPQTLSANNFAQEMTAHVLKNIKFTLSEGISEAKLSLFPKNLGHVDVKITMHEGQLIAQFAADTLAGKQMLESQLPQLRQSLQSQGLQVEKLEVTQNQNMQSSMFQDQRNQQSSNQSFRQNKNRSGNYDQDNSDFVQELSGATQTRTTAYGNSFDVTA